MFEKLMVTNWIKQRLDERRYKMAIPLLVALLVISFLVACATVTVRPTIQDAKIINAPFDKVWSALIATLVEQALPIEVIEKESGLVTTGFVAIPGNFLAHGAFNKVAVRPPGAPLWDRARFELDILAAKSGENATRVKIIAYIKVFDGLSENWVACYSKGIIEKRIFDSIMEKID